LCIMLHIWGLGFLLSWITQSYGEACTEQHRKQNNSLLEIDGLQVGVSSSIACHTSCIINQWLCRYNMPRSLNNVQCCFEKVGVLVMLKMRKSNVPLCSNFMEVMGFFQVGTRWMSDKHVKGTHPLHKFRKILL